MITLKNRKVKMEGSDKQEPGKKIVTEVNTFPVPFPLEENQQNIIINTNTHTKAFKSTTINQAFKLQSQGNISEAAKYYQQIINQGVQDHRVYSNYGILLQGLGKLQEAELSIRKAIELNPDFAEAYCNLGVILQDIGNLKEAELSTRKAIELNPDFAKAYHNLGNILNDIGNLKEAEMLYLKAIQLNSNYAKAYYSLSLLKFSNDNKIWQDTLFSESILNNKSKKDQIEIYFAKANILHREKNYEESAKFLKLANQLKLTLQPSQADSLINQSKILLIESDKLEITQKEYSESPESIFIVGMPRCGSTLLESILSMNTSVDALGECNILQESFLDNNKGKQGLTLAERYLKKIKDRKKQSNKTTNKNLYNYLYTGIIANRIQNSKIIHCYRHPLDNILSIYRAHFAKGNEYSSSLVDCANVYLNQEEIMSNYKNRFRSKIYDLNYNSLVRNPNKEIKSLINWLDWEWDDSYLSPHLNDRSIQTRSNVQVRSPINSKSIGGWKNYKEMLKPAIEILAKTEKYQDITS